MFKFVINDIPSNQQPFTAGHLLEKIDDPDVFIAKSSLVSYSRLANENQEFSGTGGISQNNYEYGFIPAFRNENTQEVSLSRLANGHIAPIHTLEGIPREWFLSSGNASNQMILKEHVTSGFVRQGQYYTRKQAAKAVKIFNLEDTLL